MGVRFVGVKIQTNRQQGARRLLVRGGHILLFLLVSGSGRIMDQFGPRAGCSSQVSQPWCPLLDCGGHTAVVGHQSPEGDV